MLGRFVQSYLKNGKANPVFKGVNILHNKIKYLKVKGKCEQSFHSNFSEFSLNFSLFQGAAVSKIMSL